MKIEHLKILNIVFFSPLWTDNMNQKKLMRHRCMVRVVNMVRNEEKKLVKENMV